MQSGTYYVFRSTTDKLAEHMNHITESGDTIVAPTFTGGRDWVIVCRKESAAHAAGSPLERQSMPRAKGGVVR